MTITPQTTPKKPNSRKAVRRLPFPPLPLAVRLITAVLSVFGVASLIHDMMLAFSNHEPFSFAAFGWMFETYAPSALETLRNSVGENLYWFTFVPLLSLRATLTFFVLTIGIWGVAKYRHYQYWEQLLIIPEPEVVKEKKPTWDERLELEVKKMREGSQDKTSS